jgi:hypothetical protein
MIGLAYIYPCQAEGGNSSGWSPTAISCPRMIPKLRLALPYPLFKCVLRAEPSHGPSRLAKPLARVHLGEQGKCTLIHEGNLDSLSPESCLRLDPGPPLHAHGHLGQDGPSDSGPCACASGALPLFNNCMWEKQTPGCRFTSGPLAHSRPEWTGIQKKKKQVSRKGGPTLDVVPWIPLGIYRATWD